MPIARKQSLIMLLALAVVPAAAGRAGLSAGAANIENSQLTISADQTTGRYTIRSKEKALAALTARVGAQINHRWLYSSDYPLHKAEQSSFADTFGEGSQLTIANSGLAGQPDLICILRLHAQAAFADVEVQVRNHTQTQVTVESIRVLEATGQLMVNLGGPDSADRVLSDSFSEDRPNMAIHDLADATDGMHRAVGSQLIYNRQSQQSLFVGALTSERWLTVLRLHVEPKAPKISGYEVDSEGTTELAKENSLKQSPAADQIELSLPVAPGESLASERLLVSLGPDYHAQLETYGDVIRRLHQARVSAPTPMGWWSWTAYYFGLNEGTALTNAELLAAHLKDLGYRFFHIDEGYQYARGEYTTPNATLFPHGVKALEDKVHELGLTPGIWTAPFDVSERSWIYQNHKDWLVHNAQGQPIRAGFVEEDPESKRNLDQLYMLDTTNPGAQQYLRTTYETLTKDWGIRYIKLDFMDDSAIEGYRFQPNTTALQAQRIGLQIIRQAVGDGVLLDKDGSPMLNPVGIVDAGRISCDTGHTFEASKDAAPGIAARYYMNRNFFISDPDAFSVSRQTVTEQEWHGGKRPLTLEEAQVSIALAAVSGGMYEIGDDLPTLFGNADRMALVQNRELINMARYAHAATPVDLMTYTGEDEMPSVFLLRESKRQSVLTVFNWTGKKRKHDFSFSELGLQMRGHNQVLDIFDPSKPLAENLDSISLDLGPGSVRMVKLVDTSVPAGAPSVSVNVAERAEPGKPATFSAQSDPNGVPALSYHWDFGDGTGAEGASATHTYTHAGSFYVHLTADGIEGVPYEKTLTVSVTGSIDTVFRPTRNQRYVEQH